MGHPIIEKAAARVRENPARHPYGCECFDCCLLIGAGEKYPESDLMAAIKTAIDGAAYADTGD